MSDTLERDKNDNLDDKLNPANRPHNQPGSPDMSEFEKEFDPDRQPGARDMSDFEDGLNPSSGTASANTDMSEFENEFNPQSPIVGNNLRGREDRASRKSASSAELKNEEESANKENSVNYTGDEQAGNSKVKTTVNRRFWNRKRAAIAGSVAGIGVGGSLVALTFLSGPLQFLHLSEILHAGHFSQQEDAGDGRVGKMIRYFRSGGEAGETRVGKLGSLYVNRVRSQLAAKGVTIESSNVIGSVGEVKFDTKNSESNYKGLSDAEAEKSLRATYGDNIVRTGDGQFSLIPKSGSTLEPRAVTAKLFGELGHGGVATAARVRPIRKFFGISLSPLSIIDTKLNAKTGDIYAKYKDKWDKRIKDGTGNAEFNGQNGTDDEKDSQGKDTKTPINGDPDSGAKAGSTLSSIAESKGAKVAGGVAAAVGLACMLRDLDNRIGDINYAQTVIPMIRVGIEAISVGEQIKSGQNVDPNELAYLNHFMSSTDSQTGKTNSWTDAQPIRAETGDSGGTDLDTGIKDSLSETMPGWLDWTQHEPVSSACSAAGQVVTSVVSFGLAVASGGTVNFIGQAVASYVAVPKIINYAAGILSGDALNIDKLAGAQYGNVADYGAALGSNATSLALGGISLTAKEIAQNNTISAQQQAGQFDAQNFIARTFDVNDYQSLASIALTSETNSFMHNLATTASGITSTFSSAFKLPFALYASTVHAAPTPYQYPFPLYGYSQSDLSNSAVQDPYENATNSAKVLDTPCVDANGNAVHPCGQDYISKASKCFAVNITKQNSDAVWDVIPTDQGSDSTFNPYSKTGENPYPTDCANPSGLNTTDWLRIRFFILDTGSMEGYACAEFNDADSCANNGTTTSNSDSTGSSNTVSGDSVTLAKQILANGNIDLQSSAKADIQDTADGKQVTPGPITGQNNGSASTGPCKARTPVTLDPTLLQGMLNIAAKYKYSIGDITSGHDCDTGRHPLGRAMDIFSVNGKNIDGHCTDTDIYAFLKDTTTIMSQLMPSGSYPNEAGIGSCNPSEDGNKPSWVPSNINYFYDSSDEIHVDTGVPK